MFQSMLMCGSAVAYADAMVQNAALRAQADALAVLAATPPVHLAPLRRIAEIVGSVPQAELETEHLIHGGMYARTLRAGSGVMIVGALLKVPTVLVVNGLVDVWTGEGWDRIGGYCVVAGEALRKQVFFTRSAVEMTSVFPTTARTVDEAEREITDEYEKLMSRVDDKVQRAGA